MYKSHTNGSDETFQVVEFESYPNVLVPPTKGGAAAMGIIDKQREEVLKNPPTPPDGLNRLSSFLSLAELIFEGLKATAKMTKIVKTDMWDEKGDYIANALNSDCGTGESCFKALADLGPVYVIIMSDYQFKNQMAGGCNNLDKTISKDYGINWNGCLWLCQDYTTQSLEYFTDLMLKLTKV